MRLKQATAIAAEWRDFLGLAEWTIWVTWMPPKDAQRNDGDCVWHAEEAQAWVRISKGKSAREKEETIVHELLHIRLQGHATHDGQYSEMYERGLNAIASALVRLKYAEIDKI